MLFIFLYWQEEKKIGQKFFCWPQKEKVCCDGRDGAMEQASSVLLNAQWIYGSNSVTILVHQC